VNKKRKPGSMESSSTLLDFWRVIDCQGNAVTTVCPDSRGARERANQAALRVSQRPATFCYKICGRKTLTIHNGGFQRAAASLPQLCLRSQMAVWAEFPGFVLNVPLSSVICR
jgi:hypothetical protein